MKKLLSLAVLFLFVFSACKKEDLPNKQIEADANFEIQFEQTAEFEEEDFEFRVTKIQDERCSCRALCIWEGRVKLELAVNHQGNESIREITTTNNVIENEADLLKVVIDNYKIELTKVVPEICGVTNEEDYIFTFLVSEN